MVILDIEMPGIDGFELAYRIREKIDPRPRAIAVSGVGERFSHADKEAGFGASLSRPADWSALEAVLLGYAESPT